MRPSRHPRLRAPSDSRARFAAYASPHGTRTPTPNPEASPAIGQARLPLAPRIGGANGDPARGSSATVEWRADSPQLRRHRAGGAAAIALSDWNILYFH